MEHKPCAVLEEFRQGLLELLAWIDLQPVKEERQTRLWLTKARLILNSRAYARLAKTSLTDVSRATQGLESVQRETMFEIADAAGMPSAPPALQNYIYSLTDDQIQIVKDQSEYLLKVCHNYAKAASFL